MLLVKRAYFLRLLLTTFLVVIVLVVGINVSVRYLLIDAMKAELRRQDETLLRLTHKSIDNQLGALLGLAESMSVNPLFTNYEFVNRLGNTLEAMQTLGSFVAASPIVRIIAVGHFGSSYMISNESSYHPDRFARFLGLPADYLTTTAGIEAGYYDTGHDLVFIVPLPVFGQPKGFTLFAVERAKAQGLFFPSHSGFSDRGMAVYHRTGTLVLSSPQMETTAPTREATDYLVTSFRSPLTGLEYQALTPQRVYREKVQSFINQISIMVVTLGVFGFVLAYGISRYNYRPIQSILQMFRRKSPARENSTDLSDIRVLISSLVPYTAEPHKIVEREMAAQRRYVATRVLRGDYHSLDALRRDCEEVRWRIPHPNLAVAICKVHDGIPESASFEPHEAPSMIGLPLLRQDLDGIVVWLLSAPETGVQRVDFEAMRVHVGQECRASCTIGVGSFSSDPSLLSHSYLNASTAIDFRLVRGVNTVIDSRSIPDTDSEELPDTPQLFAELRRSLRNGQYDRLEHAMGEIVRQCDRLSLASARFVFWELIHELRELAISITVSPELSDHITPDVRILTKFESFEELSDFVREWCSHIKSYVVRRESERSRAIAEELKRFVGQNYHDRNLSLASLSDTFGLSQGYLCRIFKDHTNDTIHRYLSDIRLAAAERLLNDTDISVKEIVSMVGLSDSASFIRKFRSTHGLSPGRYRQRERGTGIRDG